MFTRIELPYDYADLEPVIDAETVKTHYEKHHKTYTDNFNDLVKKAPSLEGMSAEEILMHLGKAPSELRTGLKNNGGGFYNHNLYFESLIPKGKKPSAALEKLIKSGFGDIDKLKEEMFKAATADLFGSGYAWLILKNGALEVVISPNQDSALQEGNPNLLLPLDMWEHAYYLKYKNDKKEYAKQFFSIVNWEKVAERVEKAK